MIIANIVSKDKINVGSEFDVVPTIDDIKFVNLPTLVIGYGVVCDFYGIEKVNVLNRTIVNNIFWTFDKNVKRGLYNSDIEDFIRYSYKKYVEDFTIVDLNLIQYSRRLIINIVRKLLSFKDAITYESENGVVYIYSEKIVIIVDLNIVEYVGFDIVKIREKIKEKSLVFLSGNEILIEYNSYMERLDNDIKLIPFLYSMIPHD